MLRSNILSFFYRSPPLMGAPRNKNHKKSNRLPNLVEQDAEYEFYNNKTFY